MTKPALSRPAKRILRLMHDPKRALVFAHAGALTDRVNVWDDNDGDYETRTTLAVMDELAVGGHVPCLDGKWDDR